MFHKNIARQLAVRGAPKPGVCQLTHRDKIDIELSIDLNVIPPIDLIDIGDIPEQAWNFLMCTGHVRASTTTSSSSRLTSRVLQGGTKPSYIVLLDSYLILRRSMMCSFALGFLILVFCNPRTPKRGFVSSFVLPIFW